MTFLAENLILLSLDYEKGEVNRNIADAYIYGLVGALLSELEMLGKIQVSGDKLEVIDPSSSQNFALDTVLEELKISSQALTVFEWLEVLSHNHPSLEEQLLDELVTKGILEKREDRFLWIFPREKIIPNMPDVELDIRQELREVLVHDKNPTPGIKRLVSLVEACRILPHIFSADDLPKAKERAKELSKNDVFGSVVAQAISEYMRMLAFKTMQRWRIYPLGY